MMEKDLIFTLVFKWVKVNVEKVVKAHSASIGIKASLRVLGIRNGLRSNSHRVAGAASSPWSRGNGGNLIAGELRRREWEGAWDGFPCPRVVGERWRRRRDFENTHCSHGSHCIQWKLTTLTLCSLPSREQLMREKVLSVCGCEWDCEWAPLSYCVIVWWR